VHNYQADVSGDHVPIKKNSQITTVIHDDKNYNNIYVAAATGLLLPSRRSWYNIDDDNGNKKS
jgi:hypothetical protein